MKRITIGILAHVDAGKTTLSEALLFKTGQIRSAGRVDKGNTHLDTDAIERDRGITIFSKQARIRTERLDLTLLDTPGHVDFCAETERTLQILDCAVLVISGTDGVQSHTGTLWRLLRHYNVPVFLFVNKMDLDGADAGKVMEGLKRELSGECVDFTAADDVRFEEIALCKEELLDELMETGKIRDEAIADAIAGRKLFPVWFGSALKMERLDGLLEGLERYTTAKWGMQTAAVDSGKCSFNEGNSGMNAGAGAAAEGHPEPGKAFGARVYKIGRDPQGSRLTYLRVTSGTLEVRSPVAYVSADGVQHMEKTDQIRLYSGEKYETVPGAEAGTVCAVTGLSATMPGMGIGSETGENIPVLEPVITRSLILPPEISSMEFYRRLKPYEEEEPTLHILWNEKKKVIDVQIMGEVQIEVLTRIIHERFGTAAAFGEGRIIYRETAAKAVEGVGHFEPLRHYAEVHLLIEPSGTGSGITVRSALGTDELDLHWQRLILTHVLEREHPGVLTGSALTDVRITLVSARAHLKHTEGGDFRQAVYRAIRQGLMSTECALLEPYYRFSLEIPQESVGRAISDLTAMNAVNGDPEFLESGMVRLTGHVPVRTVGSYMTEVSSYTKGRGRLALSLYGYLPCRNAEEIIAEAGYDPEADTENPASSVFCSHGAGFLVPWYQVPEYMHLPYAAEIEENEAEGAPANVCDSLEGYRAAGSREMRGGRRGKAGGFSDSDLSEIYAREFGMDTDGVKIGGSDRSRRNYRKSGRTVRYDAGPKLDKHGEPIYPKKDTREEKLIIDGYNIIFAWKELKELAKLNIDSARDKLLDIISNYQGYLGYPVTVVFDAYRTDRNPESVSKRQNLTVVFTKANQTADAYIERLVHDESGKFRITVATSDGLEQLTVMSLGALRMSASMLEEDVRRVTGRT